MSTEHLHRPLAAAVCDIGERVEPQIDALMQAAFEEALLVGYPDDQREHDALSLVFQLTAIMGAKAVILLGDRFPDASPAQIWNTAMTDLQMRIQQAMVELKAQRRAGSSLQ